MPAEATTKSLFISVITPGGLGSEDKEAVQQNKDCRLRVIIMQVEWNQDMLQSVAGYPMYYTYVRAHANRLAAKDLLKVVDYL